MKLSEVPEEYKIYMVTLSTKEVFYVTGIQMINILDSRGNLIELENGGFNKAFMVAWSLDKDRTRDQVEKNKEKLLKEQNKDTHLLHT